MKRTFTAAVIGLSLAGLVSPAAPARKPKLGVFGTINGMKFKAGNTRRINYVQSSYTVDAQTGFSILTFAASEKLKRRGPYQILVLSCLARTTTTPWSAGCIASYSEAQFKRRSLLQKLWLAEATIDANGAAVGPFNVTVESFDGATVRGRFSGSLPSYQTCNERGECVSDLGLGTASGDGTFAIPAS